MQKNDILISITADVGMIALVREDMDAYINQHVALARPKNDLYAEFLAWYFVSDDGLQQMQNKQRGATKIGLGLQDIRSIILKSLPSPNSTKSCASSTTCWRASAQHSRLRSRRWQAST